MRKLLVEQGGDPAAPVWLFDLAPPIVEANPLARIAAHAAELRAAAFESAGLAEWEPARRIDAEARARAAFTVALAAFNASIDAPPPQPAAARGDGDACVGDDATQSFLEARNARIPRRRRSSETP